MKTLLAIFLACCSMTVFAQQRMVPDGAGGWIIQNGNPYEINQGGVGGVGAGMMQGMQLLQQQQQLENQQLQNELLRKKLQQQQSTTQQNQQQSLPPEFQSWVIANPWYGRDKAKTEFAMLYAKQLRQEHPNDLFGRPFFDLVSAHVNEVFK